MPKIGKMLTEYDQQKCIDDEIESQLENWQDHYEEKPSEEVVNRNVCHDCGLLDFYWDTVRYRLTEILKKKNPDGYWRGIVECSGWMCRNGYAVFRLETGDDIVQKVLPKCDCTFKVFDYDKGIAIQNFHHDSPTGKEIYYLLPITEDIYEKEKR